MAKMSDAELMKQVRNLAASNSKSGVARDLNMSVQTFTNRLLAAASSLGEAPPKFTRKSSAAKACLLYTSPSPRDATLSRMPSSA